MCYCSSYLPFIHTSLGFEFLLLYSSNYSFKKKSIYQLLIQNTQEIFIENHLLPSIQPTWTLTSHHRPIIHRRKLELWGMVIEWCLQTQCLFPLFHLKHRSYNTLNNKFYIKVFKIKHKQHQQFKVNFQLLTFPHVNKSPNGDNSNSDQFCCSKKVLHFCCHVNTETVDCWNKHWKKIN